MKKEPFVNQQRAALMEHFRSMSHSLLVSFLNGWLTNDEVKELCRSENVHVKRAK